MTQLPSLPRETVTRKQLTFGPSEPRTHFPTQLIALLPFHDSGLIGPSARGCPMSLGTEGPRRILSPLNRCSDSSISNPGLHTQEPCLKQTWQRKFHTPAGSCPPPGAACTAEGKIRKRALFGAAARASEALQLPEPQPVLLRRLPVRTPEARRLRSHTPSRGERTSVVSAGTKGPSLQPSGPTTATLGRSGGGVYNSGYAACEAAQSHRSGLVFEVHSVLLAPR